MKAQTRTMSSAQRGWLAVTLVCAFGTLVFWLSRFDSKSSPLQLYPTETAAAPMRDSTPTESAPAARRAPHESPIMVESQAHPLQVTCRVTVQSKITRQPVASATVLMLDGDAVLIEMYTDALGQCLVPIPAPTKQYVLQQAIHVGAEGCADSHYALTSKPPSELLVLLEPEAVIRGRVVTADNAAPPNQVRVYAWSTADDPSEAALHLAVDRPIATVASALADERGYFTVSRLSSDLQYSLAAGGHGWASPRTTCGVVPGARLEEITVWRVYGCVVRIMTPESHPLPRSSLYSYSCDTNISDAVDITFPSLQLRLSGITRAMPGSSEHRGDWRSAFLGCLAPKNVATIGVSDMQYNVPGFAPLAVSIALPAVTDRLSERVCVLRPMTDLGTLRLRFLSKEGTTREQCHGLLCRGVLVSPMRVELRGTRNSYAYQIKCVLHVEHEIHGVPAGEYKVHVYGVGWQFPRDISDGLVNIGNDGAFYDVPIPELCGAVVLQSSGPLPRQRSASLSVRIWQGRDSASARSFGFRNAPYMLSGLAPGRYNVEVVTHDLAGREQRSPAGPVEINAGLITRQEFSWQ